MTFGQYLKSKQTFLVVWFAVNSLALFVNVFKIKGHTWTSLDIKTEYMYSTLDRSTDFYKQMRENRIYNLFSNPSRHYSDKDDENTFWPFGGFISKYQRLPFDDFNPWFDTSGRKIKEIEEKYTEFNGIFSEYDISEFLAYNVIMLLLLYFLSNSNRTKTVASRKT